MENDYDQTADTPSKNSYIGSYYQPPDRMQSVSRQLYTPRYSPDIVLPSTSQLSPTTPNIDSRAVVDALKTLQEKIRRLELERKQTQRNDDLLSNGPVNPPDVTTSRSLPNAAFRRELDSKLQSAESRCKVLEKQLDYMKKMVELAKREHGNMIENEASMRRHQTSSFNNPNQLDKLERLESVCLKLNRTQNLAEMKLASLERKLLKEEHERKLVQEKAEELQRVLGIGLRLSLPDNGETRPRKKSKKKHRSPRLCELEAESPKPKLPFVAGKSTSPSHSVHANVQSILHMIKHHQPMLCEQVSELSGCGYETKKSPPKDFIITSPKTSQKSDGLSMDQSLNLLSDLLLALQDELGQMSFEQQELESQIDSIPDLESRKNLLKDLDKLFIRMGEKEAQIMNLRKHMQMVERLTRTEYNEVGDSSLRLSGKRAPATSPVRAKRKSRKDPIIPKTLPLLRATQKFRNSMQHEDLSWET